MHTTLKAYIIIHCVDFSYHMFCKPIIEFQMTVTAWQCLRLRVRQPLLLVAVLSTSQQQQQQQQQQRRQA
jgi:hypothetical protein